MKHLLFILGDEILANSNFKNYIYRAYEKKFKEINEIKIQNKTDKDLPFLLEDLMQKYDFITIFSSFEYYPTVAKILATLNEDNLILDENTLVPSKSFYEKDSFMIEFPTCKINVLKIQTNHTIPNLIGDISLNFKHFCLFGIDNESAILLLETLTKSYEVKIKVTQLLEHINLVKVSSSQYGKLESFLKSVQNLFGQKFFLGKDPIEFISKKLLVKNMKISFAESCTGGLCAAKITQFSGISQIFEGSIVSYSNRLKHEWLGISEDILENNGTYSEKCIYFMLKGIFKTAKPDFALAISGIADKEDIKEHKAGTIYIGAMFKDGTYIQEILYLKGDREFIKEQAVLGAFCLMLKLKPEIFEF
ncbi:CinA family protein [Campylobacter novaezeelandiae]|uniref:CinA family protein n=1 Tax=Campylobacter novaezeelandiae TaxID=2267891 RepID=UPI0019086EFD|nr:CinA family protein [Campylobacter novaezeelandiae]MBK1964015.1 CinA family protein [Campylobacter novaezeelandiae]MBK1993741.1 CinA family protein [Campylobacter novaezeelandiae]